MSTETLIMLVLRFGITSALELAEAHEKNDINSAIAALKKAQKTLAEYKAEDKAGTVYVMG